MQVTNKLVFRNITTTQVIAIAHTTERLIARSLPTNMEVERGQVIKVKTTASSGIQCVLHAVACHQVGVSICLTN